MPGLTPEQRELAYKQIITEMALDLSELAKKDRDRERTQKRYEKVGYAIGAFVIGASGTLIGFVINWLWPGHKS